MSAATVCRAERIARAWDPKGWAFFDERGHHHPALYAFSRDALARARAVERALMLDAVRAVPAMEKVNMVMTTDQVRDAVQESYERRRKEAFEAFMKRPETRLLLAVLPPSQNELQRDMLVGLLEVSVTYGFNAGSVALATELMLRMASREMSKS